MKHKLAKDMTAYGVTWPVGTLLENFHFDQMTRYTARLPDGHTVTHIMPDFVTEYDEDE